MVVEILPSYPYERFFVCFVPSYIDFGTAAILGVHYFGKFVKVIAGLRQEGDYHCISIRIKSSLLQELQAA